MSSDEQLSARAARGDAHAFEAIFRRYHQDLYRFCLSMVGDADDAQDALQNTMVKVMRALPGEKRQIQLRPWLYRIARNESIETLRKRRDHSELEPQKSTVAGPAETAETRARLGQLLADLERLPKRQRAVLTMRELSGLSYADIAAAVETSEAAARQTLYEARVSLRQMEAGREMRCASVMRELSDADGRVTRRREIQAHLQSCADCRAFQHEISRRHRDLAAIAPLPAAAATGLLHSLLSGQAAAATGAAGAGVAGAVAAGGGKAIVGSAVVKSVAAVAVVAAVGVGVERSSVIDLSGSGPPAATPRQAAPSAPGGLRAGDATDRSAAAARKDAAGGPADAGDDLRPNGKTQPNGRAGDESSAARTGRGRSASGAGAAPPGGGHGRSAAQNGGRPAGLPAAAGGGQETAKAKKPPGSADPASAGRPDADRPRPPAPDPAPAPESQSQSQPEGPPSETGGKAASPPGGGK